MTSAYQCTSDQLAQVVALVGDPAYAKSICGAVDVNGLGVTLAVGTFNTQMALATQRAAQEASYGLNTSFLLASAYQVFLMQAGFALYAAGVVRAKNISVILLKNFTDTCIAAISFYLLGYGFAFGDNGHGNGFIGNDNFALSKAEDVDLSGTIQSQYHHWFWNFAFCSASTTILSGSIAERATFQSYLIYSVFMTTWTYPVVAHWLWSPLGWLSAYKSSAILGSGAIDFAGSGVVHIVAGFASLTGSIATGPRTGRFVEGVSQSSFKGANSPLYVLGTFLLWFGWYGFNPGSNLAISTTTLAQSVARTAVTTTLAAGAGALSAMWLNFHRHNTWDALTVCTGSLAGLVAVTAGCSVMAPWAAIICGGVAGVLYIFSEALLEALQIDDPVCAFPVHGVGGMWGVLFVGLLGKEKYIVDVYGQGKAGKHLMGIFYGGHGQLLLCQVIEIVVVACWSMLWNGLMFWVLNRLGMLRVPLEAEAMGLDQAECGDVSSGFNPKILTKFSNGTPVYGYSKERAVAMTQPQAYTTTSVGVFNSLSLATLGTIAEGSGTAQSATPTGQSMLGTELAPSNKSEGTATPPTAEAAARAE